MTAISPNINNDNEYLEGYEQIEVEEGKSTLLVFNRKPTINFDTAIKYKVSKIVNVDLKNVVLFSDIENLHEKSHMDFLIKKIKENTVINKIVVATAISGKYNSKYFNRHFDFICTVKVIKNKKK